MERLGEDEIFCIYERITKRADKNSFSAVSKKFLQVASFHLQSIRTKFPDLLYNMLVASPKMVSFECREALSNNHMKLIAESCPNIKQLSLSRWGYVDREMDKFEFDDVGLCAISNACIHLDRVDLTGRLRFKEIGIGSLVRSCKNLTVLILENCVNVIDRSLKMIGEATRLKYLSLRDCYLISDVGLEYLADGNLRYCLENLYLDKCDRITDNGIVHLKKLVSLTALGLSRCGVYITDYGVVTLSELPYLKILHLNFLINITDISLREIGSKCLRLLIIRLDGCEKITSVGLHAFSGHQELLGLSLISCYKFSFEDVKSIALTCPNLSDLSLSRGIKKPVPRAGYEEFYITYEHCCWIYWN